MGDQAVSIMRSLLDEASAWESQDELKSESFVYVWRSPLIFCVKGNSADNIKYRLEELSGQSKGWRDSNDVGFGWLEGDLHGIIDDAQRLDRTISKTMDKIDRLIEKACNESRSKLSTALKSLVKLVRFRVREHSRSGDLELLSDVVANKQLTPEEEKKVEERLTEYLKSEPCENLGESQVVRIGTWWSKRELHGESLEDTSPWKLELIKKP